MFVIHAKDVAPQERQDEATMKTLIPTGIIAGSKVTMGTIVIPPKTRIPLEGEGAHEQDEYSYIIRGSIETVSGGKEYTVHAGEATLIPAGEAHFAYNASDEDCEIVWVLVDR